jgi:hypothetical protein
MRRKTTHVALLSLLLAASGVAIDNYVYAASPQHQQAPAKAKGEPGTPEIVITVSAPHEDGTADVTFNITTPTTYYDDDTWSYVEGLDELTSISIQTYNSNYERETLYTVDNPGIGTKIEVTLKDQPKGNRTYFVVCTNSEGERVNYANAYVGYDTPGDVQNVQIVNNNPQVIISWEPPITGENNGYFDKESLTYSVYRSQGYYDDLTTVAENITETTATDTYETDELTSVRYQIVASNNEGAGTVMYTPNVIIGPAYELPFVESFNNGSQSKIWSQYTSDYSLTVSNYISEWGGCYTPFGFSLESDYDGNHGALYFSGSQSYSGDYTDINGYITSAPISLKDAKNPALSFYHYVYQNANNKLKNSIVVKQGEKSTVVKEYTYTDGEEDGWVYESINLSQFVGDEPITVSFEGEINNEFIGFSAFDVITIDNLLENDLFAASLTAPQKVKAGEEYTATVSIQNKGSKDAEGYSVELYLNGNLIDQKDGEKIASSSTGSVSFTETATNDYGVEAALSAKVVYDADELTSNNEAETTLLVTLADYTPAPTDLSAYVEDKNIVLSWTAPDYTLPETVAVEESFEGYAHTAAASDDLGDWTLYDDETHYAVYYESLGLKYGSTYDWSNPVTQEEYDTYYAWMDDYVTFRVLDQTKVQVEDSQLWQAHARTGNKYLLDVSSTWGSWEDWLVSPELSGEAQPVKFYIAANNATTDWYGTVYADYVTIYTSSTDTEKASFTETALEATEITSILNEGGDFQEISFNVPEGTKYFAVVISASNGNNGVVVLDDFSFVQKQTGIQPVLVGYDIYEGSTKVNEEPVTDTTYTIETPSTDVNHTYTVVAVYNVADSEPSNEATGYVSGVSSIAAQNLSVYATIGQIHINADNAQVFDIAGRKIAQTRGNAVVPVAPGTYLVRAANTTFKLLVK